jgi:very-short-patch-repair endonuclease
LLASALDSFAKHIDYKTNPEVRLSSCTWYTPDFIIGNRLIVEVDGGIHDLDYRKTPDRIRQ